MKKIDEAVRVLKSGGVIAFPTETVFGIGALLSKPKAIRRIYKIKKRPKNKPLQVLVASLTQAKTLGIFTPQALELAKKQWPGPLTLVVPKTRLVPNLISGGTGKVGLRIPAHKTILALIRKTGPLAATSANLSGEKPIQAFKEIKDKLPIDFIISGRIKFSIPSKVIDASGKIKILRL